MTHHHLGGLEHLRAESVRGCRRRWSRHRLHRRLLAATCVPIKSERMHTSVALVTSAVLAYYAPVPSVAHTMRAVAPVMEKGREAEDVGGAVANTFGDIFSNMFKPNAAKQAEIDRAYAEQLEVAARRRNVRQHRPKT